MSNPFKFSGKIKKRKYFFGREEELEEVKYTINKLEEEESPKIAISGPKGIGKSSLTHIAEKYAKEQDYLTARIDLDEHKLNNVSKFFQLVIESISKDIEQNKLNKYKKKFIQSFDKAQVGPRGLKFSFKSSNDQPSDKILKDLFRDLFSASESGIVLIIDEAQSLSNEPTIIQKMKNIFGELDGYCLIMASTDRGLNEIKGEGKSFLRSFRSVPLEPFNSEETTQMIENRINNKEHSVDEKTISEIHQITGGRPYEVNLVASRIYEYYERGMIDSFNLNSDVLESVLQTLEKYWSEIDEEFPLMIQNLSSDNLKLLRACIEYSSKDREDLVNYFLLINIDEYSGPTIEDARESVSKNLENLLDKGILIEDKEGIKFSQNLYELAYVKYYLLSSESQYRPFNPSIGGSGVANVYLNFIRRKIVGPIKGCHSHYVPDGSNAGMRSVISDAGDSTDLEDHTFEIDLEKDLRDNLTPKGLREVSVVEAVTDNQFRNIGDSSKEPSYKDRTLRFRVESKWLKNNFLCIIHIDKKEEVSRIKDEIKSKLDLLKKRLESIGVNYVWRTERDILEETSSNELGSQDSVDKLDEAISMNPEDPILWYNRALEKYELREFEEAKEDVENAIKLQENYTRAYLLKGDIHKALDEKSQEYASIKEAISLQPQDATMRATLGISVEVDGHDKRSIRLIEQAENVANGDDYDERSHALNHAVRAATKIGDLEKADRFFNSIDEESSFYSHALLNRGRGYLEKNKNKKALQMFDEATSIGFKNEQNSVLAVTCKIRSLRKLEKWEKARNCYNKYSRSFSKGTENYEVFKKQRRLISQKSKDVELDIG